MKSMLLKMDVDQDTAPDPKKQSKHIFKSFLRMPANKRLPSNYKASKDCDIL